jgi:hypothetical protein
MNGLAVSRPPFLVGAQSHNTIPLKRGWRDPGGVLPDDGEWGVFCVDQFATRYRFLDRGQPPDTCKPDDDPSLFPWLVVWSFADSGTTPVSVISTNRTWPSEGPGMGPRCLSSARTGRDGKCTAD